MTLREKSGVRVQLGIFVVQLTYLAGEFLSNCRAMCAFELIMAGLMNSPVQKGCFVQNNDGFLV